MPWLKLNLTSASKSLIETVSEKAENFSTDTINETKKIIIGGASQESKTSPPSDTSWLPKNTERGENQEVPEPVIKKKRISISDIKKDTPITIQESPKEVEIWDTNSSQSVPSVQKSKPTITLNQIVSAKTQEVLDAPTENRDIKGEEIIEVTQQPEGMSQGSMKTETIVSSENPTEKVMDQDSEKNLFSIVDGDTNVTMVHHEKKEIFWAYHSEFDKSKPTGKKAVETQVQKKVVVEKNTPLKKWFSPLGVFSKFQSSTVKKTEPIPVVEKLKVEKKPFSVAQKSVLWVFWVVAMIGLWVLSVVIMPENSLKTNILETLGVNGSTKQPIPPTPTETSPTTDATPSNPEQQLPQSIQPLSESWMSQTSPTPSINTTISPAIKKALLKKFNNK